MNAMRALPMGLSRPAGVVPSSAGQAPQLSSRPMVGILAVLCGAFISTVTGRLSTFGLADIRGAVHAGYDEGAWITTAQGCAQMLIGPAAVWLGTVFGARRVLVIAALLFAFISLLLPFSPNVQVLIGLQALAGLTTGTFIPLTISFVLRNLPPRYWSFGIAAYALNLELSLNISATLEGFYVEFASWHWIFWQSIPMAVLMAWCIHRGIPREKVNWALVRTVDWFGIASFSIGLAMIYAALDQGNRLDWFNSGLVVGLLSGGTALLVAFVLHERLVQTAWLNLSYAVRMPMPLLMVLISLLRLAILSTALLLPQFLSTVQGYRSLETGPALLVTAAPQLVIAPLVGLLLRHVDARLTLALGFGLVATACLLVGSSLTGSWVTLDFLPSQGLQAVGQTLAMSSLIFFGVLHLRPADAMTFGVLLQTGRLFGGELGTAGIGTLVRVREQVASNLIGQHVQTGGLLTLHRLQDYVAAMAARSTSVADAALRATDLLAQAVRREAMVASYIQSFLVVGLVMLGALVLIALLRAAPAGPASHSPLRAPWRPR